MMPLSVATRTPSRGLLGSRAPHIPPPRSRPYKPRAVQVAASLSDPWRVLGVDKTADDAQVKKAHRRLVLRHHPDLSPGDPLQAQARFIAIQEAY